MAELPPKLFFRIGEVAGLVGVEPHVLRYWEREFRSIRPTKSAKGQRVYSRKDVENLLRVRDLLYRDGFTIAGAKKKLQRVGSPLEDPIAEAEADADADANEESAPLSSSTISIAGTSTETEDDIEPTPALLSEPTQPRNVKEKLLALRGEIEGFLAELGTADAVPVSGAARVPRGQRR